MSQDDLADCMCDILPEESGKRPVYRQYVSEWELGEGKHTPPNPQEEWPKLLSLLECLIRFRKIETIDEANALLAAGNYRALTPSECQEIFGKYPVKGGSSMPSLPEILIGRDQEIQEWCERLTQTRLIHAITGQGGAGKTALALAVANQLLSENKFPIFVWDSDKRLAFDTRRSILQPLHVDPLSRETFLVGVARQLNLNGLLSLDSATLERELGTYLRQNPVLLVIDNLETVPDYRWVVEVIQQLFQPVRAGCASRVLMTSREEITHTGYDDDIVQESIQGLSSEYSWQLLMADSKAQDQPDMMDSDAGSVEQIIHLAHGLPLILKLVVSRYALGIPLRETASSLQSAEGEEQLYRYLFHDLWFRLSRSARIIAILAADIPGSVTQEYLAGQIFPEGLLNRQEFNHGIGQLEQASIITRAFSKLEIQSQTIRYTLHPLTRQFIRSDLPALWGNTGKVNGS